MFAPLLSENVSPYLSEMNVRRIVRHLDANEYDFILEYGSGCSTAFFLKQLSQLKKNTTLVAVDNFTDWASLVISSLPTHFPQGRITAERITKKPWTLRKIASYLQGTSQCALILPAGFPRIGSFKFKLRHGWTAACEPGQEEDLSAWRRKFNKKLFKLSKATNGASTALGYRFFPGTRPFDLSYEAVIDETVSFKYFIRPVFGADQYGESPNKADYIDCATDVFKERLQRGERVNACVLVDGGPRMDILHAIFDLEEAYNNFQCSVFLYEGCRRYYDEVISRRPEGEFHPGSSHTIAGEKMYGDLRGPVARFAYHEHFCTAEKQLEREVWAYVPEPFIKA